LPFKQPLVPGPHIDGEETWWYPGKDCSPPKERPPEIVLRSVGSAKFQLLQSFGYCGPSTSARYEITRHDPTQPPNGNNATDFASVPSLFWWLIASYGHQTRAALIHDQLWDAPGADRETANLVFRDALAESDVAVLRRWIMWAGVDAARRATGRSRKDRVGAVLQFVSTFLFLVSAAWFLVPWIADWSLWESLETAGSRFSHWIAGWSLWESLETAGLHLSLLWDWWPFGSVGFGGFWMPLIVGMLSTAIWWPRWLPGTLGIGLVLPAAVPEMVARWTLYVLEWPFFVIHKLREGDPGGHPTPKPTLRPTRAFPWL
jgi:hypothetical protein